MVVLKDVQGVLDGAPGVPEFLENVQGVVEWLSLVTCSLILNPVKLLTELYAGVFVVDHMTCMRWYKPHPSHVTCFFPFSEGRWGPCTPEEGSDRQVALPNHHGSDGGGGDILPCGSLHRGPAWQQVMLQSCCALIGPDVSCVCSVWELMRYSGTGGGFWWGVQGQSVCR